MNDVSMNDLKPCPYCGNTGPILYKQNDGLFYVQCGRYLCDTKFKECSTSKEECIKKWNENADLIKGGQQIKIGKATAIFKNIDNAAVTDADKPFYIKFKQNNKIMRAKCILQELNINHICNRDIAHCYMDNEPVMLMRPIEHMTIETTFKVLDDNSILSLCVDTDELPDGVQPW